MNADHNWNLQGALTFSNLKNLTVFTKTVDFYGRVFVEGTVTDNNGKNLEEH